MTHQNLHQHQLQQDECLCMHSQMSTTLLEAAIDEDMAENPPPAKKLK